MLPNSIPDHPFTLSNNDVLSSRWESTDKSLLGFFSGGRKQVRLLVGEDGNVDLQTVEQTALCRLFNCTFGFVGMPEVGVHVKAQKGVALIPQDSITAIDKEKEKELLRTILSSMSVDDISAGVSVMGEEQLKAPTAPAASEEARAGKDVEFIERRLLDKTIDSSIQIFEEQERTLHALQQTLPYSGFAHLLKEIADRKKKLTDLKTTGEWAVTGWLGENRLKLPEMTRQEVKSLRETIETEKKMLEGDKYKINQAAKVLKEWKSEKEECHKEIDHLKNAEIPQYARAYSFRIFLERKEKDLLAKAGQSGAKDANYLIHLFSGSIDEVRQERTHIAEEQKFMSLYEQYKEIPEGSEEAAVIKQGFIGELQNKVMEFQTKMGQAASEFRDSIGSFNLSPALIAAAEKSVAQSVAENQEFMQDKSISLRGWIPGFRSTVKTPLLSLNKESLLFFRERALQAMERSGRRFKIYEEMRNTLVEAHEKYQQVQVGLQHEIKACYAANPRQIIKAAKLEAAQGEVQKQEEALKRQVNSFQDAEGLKKNLGGFSGKLHAASAQARNEPVQSLLQQLEIVNASSLPAYITAKQKDALHQEYVDSVKKQADDFVDQLDELEGLIEKNEQNGMLTGDLRDEIEKFINTEKSGLRDIVNTFEVKEQATLFHWNERVVSKPPEELNFGQLQQWQAAIEKKIANSSVLVNSLQQYEVAAASEELETAIAAAKKTVLEESMPNKTLYAEKVVNRIAEIVSDKDRLLSSIDQKIAGSRSEDRLELLESSMQQYSTEVRNAALALRELTKAMASAPLEKEEALYLLKPASREHKKIEDDVISAVRAEVRDYTEGMKEKLGKLFALKEISILQEFKAEIMDKVKNDLSLSLKDPFTKGRLSAEECTKYRTEAEGLIAKGKKEFQELTYADRVENSINHYKKSRKVALLLRQELRNEQQFHLTSRLGPLLEEQAERVKNYSSNLESPEDLEKCAFEYEKAARILEQAIDSIVARQEDPLPLIDQLEEMEKAHPGQSILLQWDYLFAKDTALQGLKDKLQQHENQLRELIGSLVKSGKVKEAKRATSLAGELHRMQIHYIEAQPGLFTTYNDIQVREINDSKAMRAYSAHISKKLEAIRNEMRDRLPSQ